MNKCPLSKHRIPASNVVLWVGVARRNQLRCFLVSKDGTLLSILQHKYLTHIGQDREPSAILRVVAVNHGPEPPGQHFLID